MQCVVAGCEMGRFAAAGWAEPGGGAVDVDVAALKRWKNERVQHQQACCRSNRAPCWKLFQLQFWYAHEKFTGNKHPVTCRACVDYVAYARQV